MTATAEPPRFQRAMHRIGIRLDDQWRPWVEADLHDPHWVRRHRIAMSLLFGATAALLVPLAIRFDATIPVLVGLVGAALGQLALGEWRRQQMTRILLRPARNPFTAGLHFRERVVMMAAVATGMFALATATFAATSETVDPGCVRGHRTLRRRDCVLVPRGPGGYGARRPGLRRVRFVRTGVRIDTRHG